MKNFNFKGRSNHKKNNLNEDTFTKYKLGKRVTLKMTKVWPLTYNYLYNLRKQNP